MWSLFSKINDHCAKEAGLEFGISTFHLLLGLAWLQGIADASKNPMISSDGSNLLYTILALALGITCFLFCFSPFLSFERVIWFILTKLNRI